MVYITRVVAKLLLYGKLLTYTNIKASESSEAFNSVLVFHFPTLNQKNLLLILKKLTVVELYIEKAHRDADCAYKTLLKANYNLVTLTA